jgi:hypothetical protein
MYLLAHWKENERILWIFGVNQRRISHCSWDFSLQQRESRGKYHNPVIHLDRQEAAG